MNSSCALNSEWLTPKLIYKADVSNDLNSEKTFYFGFAIEM